MNATPVPELHLFDYAPSANCLKVRMLLAELGLEFERVPVDIFAGETLTEAYAQINPARTVPVLQVGADRRLTESAAILAYLAEGTELMPDGSFERAEVVRWLIYEQTDVIPATGGIRFRVQTGRVAPDDPRLLRRRGAGEQVLDLLEGHLAAGRDFFVGKRCSIADIALYGYFHVADEAGYDMSRRRLLSAWIERVESRPGHVNDLVPYPDNARMGSSNSIYD